MVRPVSCASCFFCSSEGYGCCQGTNRTNISLAAAAYTHSS
jgi:hypothetical protein